MSVGGEFRADAVTGEHWRRFADENRLDAGAVLERVHRYAETVPSVMRAALDEVEDRDGSVRELADRLLPAAEDHAASIAARAS